MVPAFSYPTAFAEILYFVHCYKQSMALFKEPQAA